MGSTLTRSTAGFHTCHRKCMIRRDGSDSEPSLNILHAQPLRVNVNPVAPDYLLLERVGRLIQSWHEHGKRGLTSVLAHNYHVISDSQPSHIFSKITRGWFQVVWMFLSSMEFAGEALYPASLDRMLRPIIFYKFWIRLYRNFTQPACYPGYLPKGCRYLIVADWAIVWWPILMPLSFCLATNL